MSILNATLALLQAQEIAAGGWETAKGVMLTLTTTGMLATTTMVFKMRDDVRDLKKSVGTDGKNGLIKKVADNSERIDAIESRHERIDAVAEAEGKAYKGPERRQNVRRMRDQEFPNPLDSPRETR